MTQRWAQWLDRYDALGVVAGVAAFVGLGALEDFGTSAGGESWIFSAFVGLGTAYLVATVLRLRDGEELAPPTRIEVTPRSYAFSVAMTAGGIGVVWGIAIGPAWLAPVAFVVFAVGWGGRAQLRIAQVRRSRHAQHDGT